MASAGATPSARHAARYTSGAGFGRPRSWPDTTTPSAASPTASSACRTRSAEVFDATASAIRPTSASTSLPDTRVQRRPGDVVGQHDLADLPLDGIRGEAQALREHRGRVHERAAVRSLKVGIGEGVAVALEQLALRVVPQRLRVQEQAVHVEDRRPEPAGQDERSGCDGHGRGAASGGRGCDAIVSAAGAPPWRFGPSEAQPNRGVIVSTA